MNDFKEFINTIVDKWRTEKFAVYEKQGLGLPSNRTMGDWAEKNVVLKIEKIKPVYEVVLSKGSQTPSDIFSISKRKEFYHLMLNQVKSTTSAGKEFELSNDEVKKYREFAKWFRKEANKFELLKGKPFVITLGYVLVYNQEKKNEVVSDVLRSTIYRNPYFANWKDGDKNKAIDLALVTQSKILK